MNKLAFVFPGQGAQETGMGKSLIEEEALAKSCFDAADHVLDFDLYKLCFEEGQPIHQTSYTQPALLAISICFLKVLDTYINVTPDFVSGLSLGEYTALVACDALPFLDAIRLVRSRGLFMEEAGQKQVGKMAVVSRGDVDHILELCQADAGVVGIANYNSPQQVVISGEEEAVDRVSARLTEEKVRIIPLSVSGAFHSPLMAPAAKQLEKAMASVEFSQPTIPYYTNVTGQAVTDPAKIKGLLVDQVKSSVRWEEDVRAMIEAGVDTFVEIGPGKSLSGLIRKTDRKVKVYNVNNLESLKAVADILNQG